MSTYFETVPYSLGVARRSINNHLLEIPRFIELGVYIVCDGSIMYSCSSKYQAKQTKISIRVDTCKQKIAKS